MSQIHKIHNLIVMQNELNTNQSEKENEAGCLGIGLFPLIGIILYFVQKNSVNNPSAYLYGASRFYH